MWQPSYPPTQPIQSIPPENLEKTTHEFQGPPNATAFSPFKKGPNKA